MGEEVAYTVQVEAVILGSDEGWGSELQDSSEDSEELHDGGVGCLLIDEDFEGRLKEKSAEEDRGRKSVLGGGRYCNLAVVMV